MTVGPIHALNGFPVWYKDENGLRLMLNTDSNDPFAIMDELPNPGQPVSFPDNFPSEAFYFIAEAEMVTGTGERARLVLALEAAFVNEVPAEGDQIVFGRVRIRVAGLQPNVEYTVTHPYGIDTFIAEPDGEGFGEINFTEDIGGLNGGNFELALESRVFPFLQWDPNVAPLAPVGYIGDPNVPHPVIGSVLVDRFGEPQNIFRIEGPGIGIGSPDRATTPGINPDNCIETRDFNVAGKISTISGVDVVRSTYSQSAATGGVLDVFAMTDVGQQNLEVSGAGINTTRLQGENGTYFARVNYPGALPPSSITVTNTSDNPPSLKESTPVDFINATANYDNDAKTLIITATSSDEVTPVILTVEDFGLGDLSIPIEGLAVNTMIVPAEITIQSSAGGLQTIPVTITGSVNNPIGVSANAGADQTVLINSTVTLDGSQSRGAISSYQWTQIPEQTVTLQDANTAIATFVAPNEAAQLSFQLTVQGEGGPHSDIVNINVLETASEPVADAGPNQTVQQGSIVTLTGSTTGEVSTVQWVQTSGPEVVLNNANSPVATFTFPNQFTTLTFELRVAGPGGNAVDTVTISTTPDSLTVNRVQFRTGDSEWRISGTSSVAGAGVTVTIYIGNSLNGTILAQVQVDALGQWEYRVEPSQVGPDATRAISLQSSSGGVLINVPINIRN
ncbi:PKD domain-containing protein [Lysinibacillus antri]|uniref:IPT/TIG domain protein n=1 Tax=Lysinibacillus antri TaxID=2498145 RepID=A0A432LBV8_9BACI|nr:IPT/TIG domain protein [Lysinibacillus antri]RUL52022.1 IPT/TIG domain protein [Lysinibacillus antri]